MPRLSALFLGLSLAGMMLAGCGAAPGSAALSKLSDGTSVAKLGFDAAGGTSPTICQRRDGSWVLAYVGAKTGDRQIFWASSQDGLSWSAPKALGAHDFSDQSPRLVEDGQGVLNLYFASNRDGANFELYHARLLNGDWQAPKRIDGFDGVESLAVTCGNGKTLLAAQELMSGMFSALSTDGDHFAAPEKVADLGADPALTLLPDGKALIAYTDDQTIDFRTCQPGGAWSSAQAAAQGNDRVREPALVWTGDRGELVYCERTPDGYALREKRFDAQLSFVDAGSPVSGGVARTPALAADHHGKISLAWGMTEDSGQSGIALSMLGD